jgi:antitoxin ParD1/3/4
MPKNTSFALSDHFQDYIEKKVQTGAYGSASEVVRESLRLMEERDVRIEALRAALIAGEQSGKPKPIDRKDFFARARSHAK